VTPTGVAEPALLDLECAVDQHVRPPRSPRGPIRSIAEAGSPADAPTRELHPIGRTPAPEPPLVTQRAAYPALQQPVQRVDGRLDSSPGRRPHGRDPRHGPRPPAPDLFQRTATAPAALAPAALAPNADPGSAGEHLLQCAYGTRERARRFYRDQVLDRLNPAMVEFVGRMELAFVGTADGRGECDTSLRAGPPGFLHVLDERRLAYPEYRGNGVHASLGNISENPHVGILMIDFVRDLIGLHVNGRARIVEDADLRAERPGLPAEVERGRTPERWVVVDVVEAYVHCRKHLPRMQVVPRDRDWGTDDAKRKGGDYFGVCAGQRTNAR
jgi:predicted pyridoxine 5'-phosphate oxidase superfamily flavin-nucleotide-binding protein